MNHGQEIPSQLTTDGGMAQLPTKRYQTLLVPLTSEDPGLWDEVDKLLNEFCDDLEAGELPPSHAFSAVREQLAQSRIPAMMKYVELCEVLDEPLLVFSAHLPPVEALKGRPGWGVITGATSLKERHEIVSRFEAGELKGVAMTIKAVGVDLTLTRASTALFVSLDWSPANNIQAEEVMCQGLNQALVVRMVSKLELDQRVMEVLDRQAGLE